MKGLEFPMKVKDIPKFENLNNLNVNVFELTGAVLTPIKINKKYLQPQIDLMLFENHYCLITKLHCLINKNSHMKWVCRRCLTAFSSEDILNQHIDRCQKQQPTKITFSWNDHLKFLLLMKRNGISERFLLPMKKNDKLEQLCCS